MEVAAREAVAPAVVREVGAKAAALAADLGDATVGVMAVVMAEEETAQ
jgi:hypothetical protein